MLKTRPLYTKEREKSDMADLEILGGISFDLHINKDEEIKNSFVSLVGKLGTREFLEEYCVLYSRIMAIRNERGQSIYYADIPQFAFEQESVEDYISEPATQSLLDSCTLLQEISISSDYVNKNQ
ncbi:hypothetical protein NEIG_01742 [Nematocida sp. ERTm5]|nr:hypothetical protein NEIG_01742 [Nematocida sp. ERTm5]